MSGTDAAPLRLLVDTDIGSDIDDEFTLAMIWGSPELDLVGLSASYGDVVLRTRIARRMAELVRRELLAVPGDATTWSGRDVWWAGHEGDAYQPIGDAPVLTEPAGHPSPGARLIADLGVSTPSPHLLAIGPLSTVASALRLAPGLATSLAGLWIMGGDLTGGPAEHNIVSDTTAAEIVLESDAPITLVPVDITRRVRLREPDIARIERSGELGRLLAVQARAWMRRWDEDFEIPHDPLALLALLEPRHFVFSGPGRLRVGDGVRGGDLGTTTFAPGAGTHRVVTDVDVDAASGAIVERILAGLRTPPD